MVLIFLLYFRTIQSESAYACYTIIGESETQEIEGLKKRNQKAGIWRVRAESLAYVDAVRYEKLAMSVDVVEIRGNGVEV